jgi:hypothetical protein
MTLPQSRLRDLLAAEELDILTAVTGQLSDGLLEQMLIVDRDVWAARGARDDFIFQVLQTVFGSAQMWDAVTVHGIPIVQLVRRINDSVHTLQRTPGAAKFKERIAVLQGGDFCTACGERQALLHVDHIVPVSRGGSIDHVTNLQLLCGPCNAGKSALDGELLPSIMTTAKTRTVSPRLKFKRLLLTSLEIEGRRYGRCMCGITTRDSPLVVEPRPFMSANLLNLIVLCEAHREG